MGDHAEPIVSCEWLQQQIEENNRDLLVVDVSWYSAKDAKSLFYDKYHIPGAVFLNVFQDVEIDKQYPRNLPTDEVFQKNVRAIGVNRNTHVILYSTTDVCGYFMSGRAWWMFKVSQLFGHEKVSVLDGGWSKWVNCKFPKSIELPKIQEGNFFVHKREKYRKLFSEMHDNLESKALQVCDSRPPDKYSGEKSCHIPSAVNLPAADLVTSDGILKSPDELRHMFESAGVDLSQPVATYCFSGMSSCTLALCATLCGCTDVAVYHGGMTEWAQKSSIEELEK